MARIQQAWDQPSYLGMGFIPLSFIILSLVSNQHLGNWIPLIFYHACEVLEDWSTLTLRLHSHWHLNHSGTCNWRHNDSCGAVIMSMEVCETLHWHRNSSSACLATVMTPLGVLPRDWKYMRGCHWCYDNIFSKTCSRTPGLPMILLWSWWLKGKWTNNPLNDSAHDGHISPLPLLSSSQGTCVFQSLLDVEGNKCKLLYCPWEIMPCVAVAFGISRDLFWTKHGPPQLNPWNTIPSFIWRLVHFLILPTNIPFSLLPAWWKVSMNSKVCSLLWEVVLSGL